MRLHFGKAGWHILFTAILTIIQLSSGEASAVAWRIDPVDTGVYMGFESDMVLDASGKPHLAYFDEINEDLKYATREGLAWSTFTVSSSGRTGSRPAIALDPADRPHIIFENITMSGVSYAAFSGSSWTVTGLDWLNEVGDHSAIAVDSTGRPHFAYYYATDGDLRYLTLDGVSWSSSTIDSAGNVGYFVSMALDSAQNPHVAYYDFTNGKLKYARWNGSSWSIETPDPYGTTGQFTSLVLDHLDRPHISYGEYVFSSVRYAKKIGASWEIEQIAIADTFNHETYTSLRLDSKGAPHMVLRSSTTGGVLYARKTGAAWELLPFQEPANPAFASLALDNFDVPHLSFYAVDGLKYSHPAPSAPQEIHVLDKTLTSLKLGWPDVSGGFTGYRILDASDGEALSGGLVTGTTYWLETELSTNTAYSRSIAAFASVLTDTSAPVSVYTLAAPPAASAVTQVSSYSVTVSWGANTNPGYTVYELSRSTDNFTASFSTPVPAELGYTGLSYSDAEVSPETTYYYRVRAYNGDLVPTVFDSAVSTTTHPAVPAAAAFSPWSVALSSSSVNWAWNIPSQPSIDGLRVISGGGDSLSGDLPPSATFYVQSALYPNTSAQVFIEAFNVSGVSRSGAAVRYTLANPPVGISSADVEITSVSVCWGNNFNPPHTSYVLSIWETVSSTTSVTVSSCCAAVTGLYSGTTYYFSVTALNGDGLPSPGTGPVSAVTEQVPYMGIISPGLPAAVEFHSPHGKVFLDVPSGAFGEAVQLTASAPSVMPPGSSRMGDLKGTGVGVELSLNLPIQPAGKIRLTVSYRAADVAGMDENRLVVARYDPAAGAWIPLVSFPDPDSDKVSAMTDHFSTFQVMQTVPSASVNRVKIAPNPLRPAKGHTSMMFTELPALSVLRIYSLGGELIREIYADASGIASWDGRNRSGVFVASGVYFVFAEKGGDKTTFKVAVQR